MVIVTTGPTASTPMKCPCLDLVHQPLLILCHKSLMKVLIDCVAYPLRFRSAIAKILTLTLGSFELWNFRSRELSLSGAKGTFAPGSESSIGGTFAPGSESSMELSFHGTKLPWNFRSQNGKKIQLTRIKSKPTFQTTTKPSKQYTSTSRFRDVGLSQSAPGATC